jgi:pimeloyl-ACP methyl ester carboxylesterase
MNNPSQRKRQRSGCLGSLFRLSLKLLALIGLFIAVGFLFEIGMKSGDPARYPRPGELINIAGRDMHLFCIGEGSPTVLFVGGAGALSYQDMPIQAAISAGTRACVYDRAGYLWSEARPEMRTAWQLMDELHTLLTTADVRPPYILVGSSNGGLYARAFAYQYPDDVAGLVLVDARLETELGKTQSLPVGIFQLMGQIGLFRLFPGIICPESACDLTYREEIAVFRGYPNNLTTYERELVEGLDGSPEQITMIQERLGVPGLLGNMPVIILHANQARVSPEEMEPGYRAFLENYRAHYSRLSTNTRYMLLDSGHGIAVEHPDVLVDQIRDVLEAARTGKPLIDL